MLDPRKDMLKRLKQRGVDAGRMLAERKLVHTMLRTCGLNSAASKRMVEGDDDEQFRPDRCDTLASFYERFPHFPVWIHLQRSGVRDLTLSNVFARFSKLAVVRKYEDAVESAPPKYRQSRVVVAFSSDLVPGGLALHTCMTWSPSEPGVRLVYRQADMEFTVEPLVQMLKAVQNW